MNSSSNTIAAAAIDLARVGWLVLPLRPGSKLPMLERWPERASSDATIVAAWWAETPAANVGIATGAALFVLDVDTADGKRGAASLAALEAAHGPLPATLETITASGGRHLYFSSAEPVRNSAGKLGAGLDVRGAGGYVVAPPSVTDRGAYRWGRLAPVAPAPDWMLRLALDAAPTAVAAPAIPASVEPTPELLDDLRSALATLPANNRTDWIAAGAALRQLGDVGRDLWIEWSATSPKHDPQRDPDAWETLGHDSTGPAAVFARAQRAGWINPRSMLATAARVLADGTTTTPGEPAGAHSPCSHLSNAHRIVQHFGDRLLYVEGIGWHTWSPPWKHDELATRRVVQGLGRIIAAEAVSMGDWVAAAPDKPQRELREKALVERFKWASLSESEKVLEPSLRMAAALLNCKAADLDANPDLLGLPGGVLDLRTGSARPHLQADRVTKVAGCDFDATAPAPTWTGFVAEILGGDADLIDYVQKLAGYTLSGRRGEHLLPILYGSGANGKSTFIGALQSMLGEYASSAAPGLLIQRSADQHASATSDLQGRRLVVVSETGEFGRLNEEQVKALTGGDRVHARRLYQSAFEFDPTHLLMLQTNHRPRVAGTDEGIWRRLRLIPFTVTVPPERRDPDLPAKLRAELPGILAWCWRGLQAHGREGFRTPAAVRAATAEYRSASDQVGAWLAECCTESRAGTVPAAELYASYSAWCAMNGERPRSQRDLGLRLTERGFEQRKGAGGSRRWDGLKISHGALEIISGSGKIISGAEK